MIKALDTLFSKAIFQIAAPPGINCPSVSSFLLEYPYPGRSVCNREKSKESPNSPSLESS